MDASTRIAESAIGTSESERTLIVLLHGFHKAPASLDDLKCLLRSQSAFRDASFFVPALPLTMRSTKDPVAIANDVVCDIDRLWAAADGKIDRIVLIGHSYGALLARMVYVVACGETAQAPFEKAVTDKSARSWAARVERLVLLAGMNRGWRVSHHLGPLDAVAWTLGVFVGAVVGVFKQPTIFHIRQGAPFIAQLRVQWLWMRRLSADRGVGQALTVQLLGSVDDMVAPEDNVDLVSGRDFVYLDVPHSGHADVIKVADARPLPVPTARGGKTLGAARAEQILKAVLTSADELKAESVSPDDHEPVHVDESVRDVVFVIHGIRDRGYWTHKIARRVQTLARQRGDAGRRIATVTSSYGYFPMLPFVIPHTRRKKVEWLMDQYTEALARWPNARFSFIGHSNGTYLLAKALEDYPSCRFENVIFAGSVVRTRYAWTDAIRRGQVKHVLNYVATSDWVVAIFPKAFEMVRLQDLGSAGHDGFRESGAIPEIMEIRYVRGAHSAALEEENWEAMAGFILDGKPVAPPPTMQAPAQPSPYRLAGMVSPALLLAVLGLLAYIGFHISQLELGSVPLSALATVAFAAVVWKIVTRI